MKWMSLPPEIWSSVAAIFAASAGFRKSRAWWIMPSFARRVAPAIAERTVHPSRMASSLPSSR